MSHFVGIDLGTTNSAICSYNGEQIRIHKSPEQNDVTPSVIYFDRRGNKYVGRAAYDNAARNPRSAAAAFKRLMGTSTPLALPDANKTLSPEECSAEILRTLFGYLPEEARCDTKTGTVITVPAAFNQMQRDATHQAAQMANIGSVALMQEPVAAIMAVMRERRSDGTFVVYDFGGGTLDIAVAESVSGRVTVLEHAGIEMCGGRDFDRALFDRVVRPWLAQTFTLPEDLRADPRFSGLLAMSCWAVEKAKIELSSREEAVIVVLETDLGVRDLAGEEIFLEIPLKRRELDAAIAAKVDDSIDAVASTLKKAGLSARDVERIVFIGGPTHYKPLRDRVTGAIGIAESTHVNPMTAVAEGAAVFAESIEWSSQRRERKSSKGGASFQGLFDLRLNFTARTPDTRTRVVAAVTGEVPAGTEWQIDSMDSGWSSGRASLNAGAQFELVLGKAGENTFKVFVFEPSGAPVAFSGGPITITRTAATVDAIPASSSVGIAALDRLGGRPVLDYLVRRGDSLPMKGRKVFKAGESLRAGAAQSLRFKIWEGEIADVITDNQFVGEMEIRGTDFEDGVIRAGADLVCEFEVTDAGNVILEVSVPEIKNTFHSGRNFYARQVAQHNFADAAFREQLREDVRQTRERAEAVQKKVDDPALNRTFERLDAAEHVELDRGDAESTKQALDHLLEAKRHLAEVRGNHRKPIRQMDLDACVEMFKQGLRPHARPTEVSTFENLARTAQRAIDKDLPEFDVLLDELRGKCFEILWRQDWFVLKRFNWLSTTPSLFADAQEFGRLVTAGKAAVDADDLDRLRQVVAKMDAMRPATGLEDDVLTTANIVKA